MMLGVGFVLVSCTNAQEEVGQDVVTTTELVTEPPLRGYSLEEMQERAGLYAGVYIKRGDRFFALESYRLPDRGERESRRFVNVEHAFGQLLHPDDELVIVGHVSAWYREYKFSGYYVNARVYASDFDIRINRIRYVRGTTAQLAERINFTHINGIALGEHPGTLEDSTIAVRDNFYFHHWQRHNYGFTTELRFLSGEPNQNFTLGRWERTTWDERTVTIDTRLYWSLGSDSRFETTTTTYGYFVLNRPDGWQTGMLVELRWGTNNAARLEIE